MKQEFTRGPREIAEHTNDIVAEANGEGHGWDEIAISVNTPANAALIRMAPDMFNALNILTDAAEIVCNADAPYDEYDIRTLELAAARAQKVIRAATPLVTPKAQLPTGLAQSLQLDAERWLGETEEAIGNLTKTREHLLALTCKRKGSLCG